MRSDIEFSPSHDPRRPSLAPRRPCLPEGIGRQALRHPDRPALLQDQEVVTYGELMERASALAARLQEVGVRRESPVAVCLPRGADLVTSVLGIWLAAGACLLIDPDTPRSRRDHLLRDSESRVVVTTPELAVGFPSARTLTPAADGHRPERGTPVAARPGVHDDDLAYLVYTSGTTGAPKGVLVEHGSLAAVAAAHEDVLDSRPARLLSRVALNSSTASDVFYSDLAHLASGRTLVILDEATRRDPDRLAHGIRAFGIDVLNGTPTQIRAMLLAGHADALAALKTLILGGEPIDRNLWDRLRSLPHVRVHNFYGPSECTIDVTTAELARHRHPVIGSERPGTSVWILDEDLRPVPDGQSGEICVTGTSLARGYTHPGPAESARFTHLHLPGGSGPVRVYRTGDMGRRDTAGVLEFLGRTDDQVSISGYRVELGEVEAALRGCDGVRDTAVGLEDDGSGERRLEAWVVLAEHSTLDQIRQALADRLPRHMLPRLHGAGAIPMGPTGKADTTALRAAVTQPPTTPATPETTETMTEEAVHGIVESIWCDTLGVAAVTPSDDFFDLGGDSVRATQMVVLARERLTLGIPIRTIFDHSGFAVFCKEIDAAMRAR
ncbi:non-ribosomal peptide synthetase [Nonomuraea sp. NPDC050643]|uniref:non-ribosomal peptide synthetase n=1 Tax=Nonomuraea sp. NPDC050643 TaxID=3155660 RepID=UPI0033EC714A